MKKTLTLCIIFIIIGYFLGKEYQKEFFLQKEETYYFLQEGIYENKDVFEKTQTNLKKTLMEYKDNKIYIYIAITRNLEIAEEIKRIYKDKNIDLDIVERKIQNEELKITTEQLDLLVDKATTEDEILKIEEVVIANYEEIIKNREES